MNRYKRISLCLLIVLGLSLGLTACKPETVVETAPATSQAGSDAALDPLAAGESNSSGEQVAANPAADDPQASQAAEASQASMPTEPQRTFAPQGTGAEPNPDSPFGQLSAEEQAQLVDWLSQFASSYQNISQYFNDFARDLNGFSEGEGATLADQEFFQTFASKCREELSKVEAKAAEGFPAAAEDLKNKAAALSSWYDNFLNELGQLNPKAGDFAESISSQLDQAMQKMQDFLDSLVAFSS